MTPEAATLRPSRLATVGGLAFLLLWPGTQNLSATSRSGAGTPGTATPLHKAASAGDLTTLAALTETGNLDVRDEAGLTPLHRAMERGHLAAATLLLDKGADPNARDAQGNTPLHRVFLAGPRFIQSLPPPGWLERNKTDPSKTNGVRYLLQHADDPSMVATTFTVAFLLAAGADPKATNDAGQTAVDLAFAESAMFWEEERRDLLRLLGPTAKSLLDRHDSKGNTLLHNAVQGLDLEVVKDLIAAGADVNATNRLGRTALHLAVQKSIMQPGPVQELLKAKPHVNARDHQGMTPLHMLAFSENSSAGELASALLQAGADPNARDHRGRTPVHLLLSGEWPWSSAGACIPLLVKAGADLSARDDYGRTPLHYLAALGEGEPLSFITGIANVFRAGKVDLEARDKFGDTPLHIAARRRTWDVFEWLVKRGANLDATNRVGETPRAIAASAKSRPWTVLMYRETDVFEAARLGNLRALTKLLDAIPELLNQTNAFGQTPLRVAVLAGRTNVAAFLEARGAKWDALSALHAGRTDVLRQLLAKGGKGVLQDAQNRELLHLAAMRGNLEITKILLEAGWNPQATNAAGLSALGLARLHKHSDLAEMLVAAGGKFTIFDALCLRDTDAALALLAQDSLLANAVNGAGFSVSELAVAHGQTRVLEELLKRGVSPSYANPRTAMTLLHVAAFASQPSCAQLLLERGAVVDCFDVNGLTALHWATIRGGTRIVALLLEHGADPDARVVESRSPSSDPSPFLCFLSDTPLHLAVHYGRVEVAEQLIKAGASVNAPGYMGYAPLDRAYPLPPPMDPISIGYTIGRLESGLGLPESPVVWLMGAERFRQIQALTALLEKAGAKRSPPPVTNPPGMFPPFFQWGAGPRPKPAHTVNEPTNQPPQKSLENSLNLRVPPIATPKP
ncbi:MAG: ankyrin repeat domain-containing protein [Verrucomicrobiae bacterium]|nr:ankyrin repeat domain-containing protein [Verrucomicrobiae bacterium]